MTKEELALAVIERLKQEYPDADCTLDYDQAWKLLVSVRLAAQCTDARVNVVVEDLYAKYPDIDALANATPEEIEEIVRPCGLGKSKARDINACMRMLRDEYHSQVPDDFNALLKLPGGARWRSHLSSHPPSFTSRHCRVRSALSGSARWNMMWRSALDCLSFRRSKSASGSGGNLLDKREKFA